MKTSAVSGNNSVVECNLAKVDVAGSNPVSRSIFCITGRPWSLAFLFKAPSPSGKAEVCKTSITGSNPVGASILRPPASGQGVFYSLRTVNGVPETAFYFYLLVSWLLLSICIFAVLFFMTAPYGRHARQGWGPKVGRTFGWVLMESPAVILPFAFFFLGNRTDSTVIIAFLAIWSIHYINRTLVFPFRMRGGTLEMPLMIVMSGFFFNLVNGYLNWRYLTFLGPNYAPGWFADPRFIVGLMLFVIGFGINLNSDSILRRLRKPGEKGYGIPTGGLYRFVSCPNYLGEIIEWAGWAVLTWSAPGLIFAVWTAANLVPRARSHHKWCVETFPDYPRARKAVIPFLF